LKIKVVAPENISEQMLFEKKINSRGEFINRPARRGADQLSLIGRPQF
jgi:hypothetical protein